MSDKTKLMLAINRITKLELQLKASEKLIKRYEGYLANIKNFVPEKENPK